MFHLHFTKGETEAQGSQVIHIKAQQPGAAGIVVHSGVELRNCIGPYPHVLQPWI